MGKERVWRCGGREQRIAGSEKVIVEEEVLVSSPLGERCWILMMRAEDSSGGEEESWGESGVSEGSKSSRERLAIGEDIE